MRPSPERVAAVRSAPSASRFQVDKVESPTKVSGGDRPSGASAAASKAGVGKSVHFEMGDMESPGERDPLSNVETLERVPHLDHYRNMMSIEGALVATRPTLAQLHEDQTELDLEDVHPEEEPSEDSSKQVGLQKFAELALEEDVDPGAPVRVKFGWIKGVFMRCVLNILGVMLYLRISWVTGQAGIALGSVVVLLSAVVTSLTTISMCAIATNGEVKAGGAYFMISRSLGPQFGGSIGLIFAFANAVGAAMYIVGFAETVRDLLKEYGLQIVDGGMNDIRIIGIVTCLVLAAVCMAGVSFEARMQLGLLVVLLLSLVDYWVGLAIPVNEVQRSKGVTNPHVPLLWRNLGPAWRDGEGFFSVFGVFFPAATGIMAGANISGDLNDPAVAIPKGTLWAIFFTSLIYLSTIWVTGMTCMRDASGSLDFRNLTTIDDVHWYLQVLGLAPEGACKRHGDFVSTDPTCVNETAGCPYGLMNYFQVMEATSAWGPLITAGIFAATLSSALASMVSAPKIFQAVCKDRLFPYIEVFAKGYGKDQEPRLAYLLGFLIAIVMILIGDLNAIAPIISNFFLASYALINYSVFDASYSKQPGFRPAFKYYSMWLSLIGALLCLGVMFIIKWVWEWRLVTFAFIALFYTYLFYRKPDVNWGSSTQAHVYKSALDSMTKLTFIEEHVKNYRPQILVLTGNPVARPSLVDFVANITKDSSLLICGHVFLHSVSDRVVLAEQRMMRTVPAWLHKRRVRAFYVPATSTNFRYGVQSLLLNAGLGKLRPNIMMCGFKNDWRTCPPAQLEDYFKMIHDAFDMNYGVGILRLPSGLDFSELMKEQNVGDVPVLSLPDPSKVSAASTAAMHALIRNTNSFVGAGDSAAAPPRTADGAAEKHDTLEVPQPRDTLVRCTNQSNGTAVDTNHSARSDESRSRSGSNSSFADKFATGSDKGTPEEEDESRVTLLDNGNSTGDKTTDTAPGAMHASNDAVGRPGEKGGKPGVDDSPSKLSIFSRSRQLSLAQKELIASINQFKRRVRDGTIDVWWLYDDGGLALLVPYLLTLPGSYLTGGRLRVFAIAQSKGAIEHEHRNMAALLSKFRIDYSGVFIIPDITRRPSASTIDEFERTIAPFRQQGDGDTSAPAAVDQSSRRGSSPGSAAGQAAYISDAELLAHREKTWRQLRTRELLQQHSTCADLVVLTMPVPRKGACGAPLYMAWLETLTRVRDCPQGHAAHAAAQGQPAVGAHFQPGLNVGPDCGPVVYLSGLL